MYDDIIKTGLDEYMRGFQEGATSKSPLEGRRSPLVWSGINAGRRALVEAERHFREEAERAFVEKVGSTLSVEPVEEVQSQHETNLRNHRQKLLETIGGLVKEADIEGTSLKLSVALVKARSDLALTDLSLQELNVANKKRE